MVAPGSRRFPRFVIRTDVKSYYASIDHQYLMERLSRVIQDPRVLNLIEQYLGRTAEQGGLFWESERGIPLEAIGIFGQGIYVDPQKNVLIALHSARAVASKKADWALQYSLYAALAETLRDLE